MQSANSLLWRGAGRLTVTKYCPSRRSFSSWSFICSMLRRSFSSPTRCTFPRGASGRARAVPSTIPPKPRTAPPMPATNARRDGDEAEAVACCFSEEDEEARATCPVRVVREMRFRRGATEADVTAVGDAIFGVFVTLSAPMGRRDEINNNTQSTAV